jgi:hypothetical protein
VAARSVCRQSPAVGARCGNSARRDLCGGYAATRIPTAILGPLGVLEGFPAGSEAVALAGECKDSAVMHESVDDGRGGHLIGKDLGPLLERQVRRERDASTFVPLRDELKEQVGRLSFERNIPEFVDEQQVDAVEGAIVPFKRCGSLGGDELHEQRGGRCEQHAVAAHAHGETEGAQDVALADSRRSAEDYVAVRVDECSVKVLEELRLWATPIAA